MKHRSKRFLSILLSLALVLGMFPGMSLTAYAATSHNITINTAQHGTVTASVNGSAATSAEEGATVTLTATPDNGYRLKSISGTYKGYPHEDKSLNGTKTITGTYFNYTATDAAGAGWKLGNNSSITISSTSKTITKVEFNISQRGNSFNVNNVSCTAGTKSLNGNTLVVSSVNTQSITLSSDANNAGYVRFNSVKVYYSGTSDETLSISGTGNVRTFTMPAVATGTVSITPEFEEIPKYSVTLTGGANATTSGGATTQSDLTGAMTTVTYTANTGYYFAEFTDITNNGIIAKRTNETTVTVSGTPLANVSITIPDAMKQVQTITASDVTAIYGDTDKSVSATTDGNGAISYAVKDGSGDYIDVNATTGALTIKKVPASGKAYVIVKAAATDDYAETTKEATVTISKAEATVAAKDQSIMVGGTVPDLSAPVLNTHYTITGLVGTDALTTAPTLTYQKNDSAATPDSATAGTYDIVPSGASAGDNYNISYTKGTLTITAKDTQNITASDVTATYGETDKSVSATTDGNGEISYAVKAGSEDYIAVASDGKLTIKKVPSDGKAYVTVTASETNTGGTDGNGYAAATKDVTVNISKATVTITAKDQSIYVGGTVPTLSGADFYTVTGLVGTDTLTTAPTLAYQKNDSAATPDNTVTGTYDIVASGASAGDNYNISYTKGTLTISEKQPATVTKVPTAKTLTYNGSAQELVTAGTATGGEMQYALGTATKATEPYTTSIPTATDAGTYYVWYFVAVDDGYDYGEPACVKVIIEEAEPQPEPGVETVDIYGDVKDSNDAPLSAVTVQLKRGYTVLKETVTDGEGKYIFKNVKPGEYNIVATDADGIVKTILVTVSNLNKDAGTIKMPAGDVSSKLVVEPSDTSGTMNIAAGIVVGGLDDLADEVAQEGETTEVIMTVKDNSDLTGKTDDELTEEQILTKNAQSQIKDEAKTTGGQQKTLQFMDFSIIKVVSGNDIPGYISDTVRLLTMVIPFDTTGKYQLGLYRYHEGEEGEPTGVQTITTAPNAYGEKIEIGPEAVTAHVRFFSNYAIGYTTKQEIVDPVNPRRRGGGGGGASSGAVTTTATEVKIITFDANGGEGNMNSQLISGSELKLNGCTFTRDGYIFIGWNTKPDGSGTTYKDGESAKLTDSVKLYALWRMTEEEKYAAMMDLNSKLSVTATEKGFKVTWGKVKDASKYVIYAAYCGKGNTCKKVEELKGTKHNYSLTGLDGAAVDTSKDLKLYVVVYRTVNGKQVKTAKSLAVHVAGKTSDETNAKKVTADKDNISLSVGKTASLTAKITLADKKKKSLKHTAELRYRSSDKSVVTADKEGKLTAKGAGTAYVYIYAQNGVSAKVEVTVS